MVRSFAVVVFVGAVAAAGIYVGTRPTVIDGRVMGDTMLEQVRTKGVRAVDCDRSIPVRPTGAVFACTLEGDDGSTARFEYTMDREGALSARLLDAVPGRAAPPRGAPGRAPRAASDGEARDPWGD